MGLSGSALQVQEINQEFVDIERLFEMSKNNSVITTDSGRSYRVANVLEDKEGNWFVTNDFSKGMFSCVACGTQSEPKWFDEDTWIQVTYDETVALLHSKDFHYFNEHPDHVSQKIIDKFSKVFLG